MILYRTSVLVKGESENSIWWVTSEAKNEKDHLSPSFHSDPYCWNSFVIAWKYCGCCLKAMTAPIISSSKKQSMFKPAFKGEIIRNPWCFSLNWENKKLAIVQCITTSTLFSSIILYDHVHVISNSQAEFPGVFIFTVQAGRWAWGNEKNWGHFNLLNSRTTPENVGFFHLFFLLY